MKKKALVTGGTKKDAAAIAVFVINIKQTNPNLVDEIVIFHNGITENDQMLMNSIYPCKFIYYCFPDYDRSDFSGYVNDHFSYMVFCKYECFRLLDEYQIVIWSDYDVVILKDISEILDPCSSKIKMMFTPPAKVKDSFIDLIKGIDLKYDLERTAVCMPLFVLFDSLNNYQEYYEWCIKRTKELGKYLYLPEQAIVNLLLQEFNLDINDIMYPNIYVIHPVNDNITNETKIIHAYGQPKFWNGLKNETWENNYQEWLRMNGSIVATRQISYKIKHLCIRVIKKAKKLLANSNDYKRNNSKNI